MSPAVAAGERLRSVLAMLPWIHARGGATLEEIAQRFGITAERARADLETAAMCGAPPFTPDRLIDLYLEGDTVVVSPLEVLTQPTLTAADGLRVLAAGRALLALDGDEGGPLASALAKLEAKLGPGVQVDVDRPVHLDRVQHAARAGHVIEIEYYSLTSDEVSRRRIEPRHVFLRGSDWYVDAHDHRSGETRRFRVSRIHAVADTDELFTPSDEPDTEPDDDGDPSRFLSADATEVALRLPASAAWVSESYPILEQRTLADGGLEVRLGVAGRPWLERLLLRVGPGAEVLEPAAWRDLGGDAARRVLARYE